MPSFSRTVRFRLTVWYSSLLLVFGVAFVVSLNLAVRLDHKPPVYLKGVGAETQYQAIRGPGGAINGFEPVITPKYIVEQAEDQFYAENLSRLRTWSLVAVVGLAVASGVGGYVVSGALLRPVRDMTKVASEISASNLTQRINHQGPDDELKALADTFDSMIGRLATSFDRQRQFVQDASHELRTPLAAIRTNIEVAEMDPDIGPAEYRELLETVKTQTARLTRLSEDLLLLGTDDRDQPDLEPVDINEVATEVVRQLTPVAARKSIELTFQPATDIEAHASADLLYRCMFNLVDNAIKYSGENATVTLRTAADSRVARVDVIDNGPGIPLDAAGHVFDRFYRVDRGRSRRDGGTGLGLAIVKQLVTQMGGSVALASTEGAGSTFTLRLPLAVPPAGA
jgi:signal transduction histidine kinase